MQTQVPRGRQHPDQVNRLGLGCESAIRLVPSTSIITIYYHSAQKLILVLASHRGWKAESTQALQEGCSSPCPRLHGITMAVVMNANAGGVVQSSIGSLTLHHH